LSREIVLAIVGPTASGKTSLGVSCALNLHGELVGTDSMQAYQGLSIGTAKPTPSELNGIQHHMLDVWPIDHSSDVAEFQLLARDKIQSIFDRDQRPIVVGGSVLYINAVLDKFDFPGTDPQIRDKYQSILEDFGPEVLHRMLIEIDPEAARNIQATNGRRLVRALEVNEFTGSPFPAVLPEPIPVIQACRVGLEIDRSVLDHRIASRVDAMLVGGLLQEVSQALESGLRDSHTARRAIGYAQIVDYLDGLIDLEQARDEIISATTKFARRQQRWFRQDQRITWFEWDSPDLVERVLGHFNEVLSAQ